MIAFLKILRELLLNPKNAFKTIKEMSLGEAMAYYIILISYYILIHVVIYGDNFIVYLFPYALAIDSLFIFMLNSLELSLPFSFYLLESIIVPIFYNIVIVGIILHFFISILGGKENLKQTIKIVIYSSTPTLLFEVIPYIGTLFGIWSLILGIIGIKEIHKLSTSRAIVSILLLIVVLAILSQIIFAYLSTYILIDKG